MVFLTSIHDNKNLCSLDVLVVEKRLGKYGETVLDDFFKTNETNETNLLQKEKHCPLHNNKCLSLRGLH